MSETILVTGAAGTVGNYVVGLAEAAGYRVVASDRTPRGIRVPVRGEIRTGDLRSATFLDQVVQGADHVIHTAALLDSDAPASELQAVNVDAVVGLFEASARAGARRFVHVSTAMLYATGESGASGLCEDARLLPRGPNGESKLAAERYLRSRPKSDLAWTILRPAPLYGRRGKHFAAGLLAIGPMLRLASPILPRPRGGPRGTMVHAEDVGRALLFVLGQDETRFGIYNVSDGDVVTLGHRIAMTFDAYGLLSFPTGPFPRLGLEAVGRFFSAPGAFQGADWTALFLWDAVSRWHGLKPALRPRFDREALTLLYDDLVVDPSRLVALGFKPRFQRFEQGWKEVLRWYQAEGWVPRYG